MSLSSRNRKFLIVFLVVLAGAAVGAVTLLFLFPQGIVWSLPGLVTEALPFPTPVGSGAMVGPSPTLTATPIPSPTPTPSPTSTPSPTPTPTPTPVWYPKPTPSPTPRPTADPSPTPTFPPPPSEVEVPILMYHYVGELPADADVYRRDLTVSAEAFEAQLQYLAQAGYHTISLIDLHRLLTEGRPLPDKPVVLTFDDGYRDAYTVVFPLLQEYGFLGTFFVLATPAHFENPNHLTWAMMAEMARAGMSIQGHGRDHVDLRGCSYDFLVYQLLGVKEAVEYHTGQPVVFFCYPSGQYDQRVIAVLESAGYWGGVTTEHGRVHTREDLFTLDRIRIRGTDSLETFIEKVEGLE
jgi:peptidoglycan/xylan/chitin deacetylase (PgdA/CDA1 family)